MEIARFFGFLHPALVHFPLVLLLVSVGLEATGFFRRDARFTWAAQVTLLLGTVGTLFAFVAGNFAEIWAARDGIPQDPMEFHELLATITSWLFVFLCAGRLYMGAGAKRSAVGIYLIFAVAGCVLLGVTGHRGAMLVYEHGAAVHAPGLHALPTHEDLATLLQKQDPDALFYSNQMHHIFGWMVFILSLMLLIDMLSPTWGEKVRKLAPVLLLAGGVYLLIFSDQDAWPLYHVRPFRPITDKEVLMHKTYAMLMLLIGLRGVWTLLRRKEQAILSGRRQQGKTMAVFSLVGGALLFTHVHSNAPYANVAAGVYIHHTVMGFIALCIGAVKLLEDSVPIGSTRRGVRALAWAYPLLMLTESIFLLNYNEGLPWFIGYRNLSLSAPHKGLIAPLGDFRAELVYDPQATKLDVYTFQQDSDKPHPVVADALQAIVKVGTDSTAVALIPETPGPSAHFTATASFLRGVPLFQTQVLQNVPGQAKPFVADFEPWADPVLASHQRTKLAFVCPMHETVGSATPGTCPLCRMTLVPNKPPRPASQLHDADYQMELQIGIGSRYPERLVGSEASSMVSQPNFVPNQPILLTFRPKRANGIVVKDLDVVHTKKLHLIIASNDLAFFDHVHPMPQPDGTLTLNYAFPHPGDYLLYADLTPSGDRNQVFRLPVHVQGDAPAPQTLQETPAQAKQFGHYRVSLALSPDPPLRNDETQLVFNVYEDGKPVTDLEPFLGAGGHCVILSQDTNAYLHSHPLEAEASRYGPSVTFHTQFARPGLYKVWGQFQHKGKPLTADFVIRVN